MSVERFLMSTRRKRIPLPTMTKPTGGGSVSVNLPKTGLLGGIYLAIRGTVSGTLSAPNALGMSSIVRRVRVTSNSSIDIYSTSGAGYCYLLQEGLESEYFLASGQNTGRSAVTATSFNLDMYIPIALNLRDPVGLLMLQNEQTLVTLTVEFETDSVVATGATVAATVVPYMIIYTVPVDADALPELNVIHQITEESQIQSGAGDITYYAPRGNIYLQLFHGYGIGVSGTDAFNRFKTRVNQSDFWEDTGVDGLDIEHRLLRGRARPAGGIFVDYLGTSGLGNYGLSRDLFNSNLVTDYASIITATGAGTLYSVRRQLVTLTA